MLGLLNLLHHKDLNTPLIVVVLEAKTHFQIQSALLILEPVPANRAGPEAVGSFKFC